MTVQEDLRQALRERLGPDARAHGFRGTSPTWRKVNAAGDCAVVNVQTAPFSTSSHLACVVNLAVAPEPWLRWQRERLGPGMPKAVPERLGLYRDRLHPSGTPAGVDGWWEVSDPGSARAAAADMAAQLESAGWPVLDPMLAPGGMLHRVRLGDLGEMKRANHEVYFARAAALLLVAEGPGAELEESLRYALEHCVPAQRQSALQFDRWVRAHLRRPDAVIHHPSSMTDGRNRG